MMKPKSLKYITAKDLEGVDEELLPLVERINNELDLIWAQIDEHRFKEHTHLEKRVYEIEKKTK